MHLAQSTAEPMSSLTELQAWLKTLSGIYKACCKLPSGAQTFVSPQFRVFTTNVNKPSHSSSDSSRSKSRCRAVLTRIAHVWQEGERKLIEKTLLEERHEGNRQVKLFEI